MADDAPPTPGLGRRDLLKKGAVAGALVWTVPVVTASAAHAVDLPGNHGTAPPGCTPDFQLDQLEAQWDPINTLINLHVGILNPEFCGLTCSLEATWTKTGTGTLLNPDIADLVAQIDLTGPTAGSYHVEVTVRLICGQITMCRRATRDFSLAGNGQITYDTATSYSPC